MDRCAAAKVAIGAVPLLSTGDEVETMKSVLSLTPGESRVQPAPPLAPRGLGLDCVRRTNLYVAPDGKQIWGCDWAGFSVPMPLNKYGGATGRVEML
jgi:hypothetical protein